MTPRENLLSIYRRNGYEFVPVRFSLTPAMREKMCRAMGENTSPGEYFGYPEGFARHSIPGPNVRPREEIDWRAMYDAELHHDTAFDAYGVAMEGGYKDSWHLKRMHHPMAAYDSLEQMKEYPWPQWDLTGGAEAAERVKRAHDQGCPAVAHMACTIWEKAWALRDMTVLMVDMAMEDEKAAFILDRITEDSAGRASFLASAGVDIIELGDDIGMQSSPMMSLDMYRTWLKPRLKKIIDAARAGKPDVLIHYHSCGYVEPFIPDLMEAGIDILNPVQPESMDFARLHAEYGSVLSFDGTLGTQTTMPFGSPEDVRKDVVKNLDLAGGKGGLTVSPTHVLEPEVPWENVEAYVYACKNYGT